MTKTALQLAVFVVAAVPGYVLAIARRDRTGHRRPLLDTADCLQPDRKPWPLDINDAHRPA